MDLRPYPHRPGLVNHTLLHSRVEAHSKLTMADAHNRRARLTSAYHELGRQLTSGNFTVIGNYTLQRTIGQGTYGKVRLATHRLTNSRVAVKQIPKEHVASLTREIHHHRRMHHQNVLQLYEVIQSESCIWMVTELCANGELYDYVVDHGCLSEAKAKELFGQMCLAVSYIHSHGIVHRDLKLENILLDSNNQIKLSDFGFTREFEPHQLLRTRCGTTAYAAPEMLAGKPYQGPEVDIWSLGVILFVLVCGYLPFDDDNEPAMQWKIVNDPVLIPETLSENLQDLLAWILQKDGSKRPSIYQILSHPWYQAPSPSTLQRSSSERSRYQSLHMRSISPNEPESTYTPPSDFVAMLTQPAYIPFESPVEQQLFHMLQTLGFAVGQIRYSVQTNACDAAGALWWLLLHRAKSSPLQANTLGIASDDFNKLSPSSDSQSAVSSRRASLSRGTHDGTSHLRMAPVVSLAPVASSDRAAQPNHEYTANGAQFLSLPVSHATHEDAVPYKRNNSVISSVKSWLKKDRRDSNAEVRATAPVPSATVSNFSGTPQFNAKQEELPDSPLAPPLLPATLVANRSTFSLAPTASTSSGVSPSPSFREFAPVEKAFSLDQHSRMPSRHFDTPILRRTSSMARPGSAYGRRLSVGSVASVSLQRNRSLSVSSSRSATPVSHSRVSRQSSWTSLQYPRPRRRSESMVQRKAFQHGLTLTPDVGRLSRKASGRSDSSDIPQRSRPVSMDEQAFAAFQRQRSFSSDGGTVLGPRLPRSPLHSPRMPKVISPRVRASLVQKHTHKAHSTRPLRQRANRVKLSADDDWIDEEISYAGGLGQPNEPVHDISDWMELGKQRRRRGSPCPPKMLHTNKAFVDDTRPLDTSAALRTKLLRRDPHTPVIEEEEP